MPFYRLYYHIIWATRGREPLITREIEREVVEAVKAKIIAIGGKAYAVNSAIDHVHVGATIPPNIALSDFVGQVKGASSYHINHLPGNQHKIAWQRGFGVVSFRRTEMEIVVNYILNQKAHHSQGTIFRTLENLGEENDDKHSHVREEHPPYVASGNDTWEDDEEAASG
jgi:REP element-mobilizing transposase RayT